MTEKEAIAYIESYTWSTTRLGLARTQELLLRIGNPQKKLKFIHIAGSNGKGSCSAMLSAIFRAAGYKTGLYISPYIEQFRERIQINGEMISADALCRVTETVRNAAEAMEDHPSQFEMVTAAGLLYFAEESCDIVMLEVGMGGALDSTNAIDAPECAVIMNIGLEHTEYLGSTIAEIAATKSGIIKPGSSAVLYRQSKEATNAVQQAAEKAGVPLTVAGTEGIHLLSRDLSAQVFTRNGITYHLPLLGGHQLRNASVVLAVVDAMRRRGWQLPENAVVSGLAAVRWPARFEVICTDPLFILDGGHNPQCAEALANALQEHCPGMSFVFLTGVLADKNYVAMLESIRPFAKKIFCVTPDSPRALPAPELLAVCKKLGIPAEACPTLEQGLDSVLNSGEPAVAFGSLYMAGAVRKGAYAKIKGLQRKRCRTVLQCMTEEERAEKSRRICENLRALPMLERGKSLFAFLPAKQEPDILPCCLHARDCFMDVAYPVITSAEEMEAYIPLRETDCVENTFGIREPDPLFSFRYNPEKIETVLLPCLGFDAAGRRLGLGKGYYDRFLKRCPQALKILVAFGCQELPAVCTGDTDIPVDFIVTENGITPDPKQAAEAYMWGSRPEDTHENV